MLSAFLSVELASNKPGKSKKPDAPLALISYSFDLSQANGDVLVTNHQINRTFKIPRNTDRGFNFPWDLVLGLGNSDIARAELKVDDNTLFLRTNAHADCVEGFIEAFSLLLS
jgi:hypothetical protein